MNTAAQAKKAVEQLANEYDVLQRGAEGLIRDMTNTADTAKGKSPEGIAQEIRNRVAEREIEMGLKKPPVP